VGEGRYEQAGPEGDLEEAAAVEARLEVVDGEEGAAAVQRFT